MVFIRDEFRSLCIMRSAMYMEGLRYPIEKLDGWRCG